MKSITKFFIILVFVGAVISIAVKPINLIYLIVLGFILVVTHLLLQLRAKYRRVSSDSHPTLKSESKTNVPFITIHIPICNEPPAVVISTLKSCLAQDYKNFEIIVLDNNTNKAKLWKPVEDYCSKFSKIKFIRYPKLKGYKAGALQKCLQYSDAKAVYALVIDADYCLIPNALKKAVITAENEQLDLLQFPQAYRNQTQANDNLSMDYQHYFDIYALHGNKDNAMLSTGTLSFFRINSLKSVPGWKNCRTITEDAEIGLQLVKANKTTLYCNSILGYGLMPNSSEDLRKQRIRWMFGNMQVIANRRWKPWKKNQLNIITQLTAWINFLFPCYLACGIIAALHKKIVSKDLEVLLVTACVPFVIYLFGKLALYSKKNLTLMQTFKVLAVNLHLNFQASLMWIPALFGFKRPFNRTPKIAKMTVQYGRPSFVFALFLVVALIALVNNFYFLTGIYMLLSSIYLSGSLYTLGRYRKALQISRPKLQIKNP